MSARNKIDIVCDWCGMKFEKCPSVIKKHNFCCRACLANFSNKAINPKRYNELKNYAGQSRNMSAINRRMKLYKSADKLKKRIRNFVF